MPRSAGSQPLVLCIAGLAACGSGGSQVAPPPPPPPPAAPAFHITPAISYLPWPADVQFQAVYDDGSPAQVRWRIDHAEAGTITQGGLLTTSQCGNGGPVLIEALLLSDSTRTAKLATMSARTGPPTLDITRPMFAGTQTPASLDSLTGLVSMVGDMNPQFGCHLPTYLKVTMTSGLGTALVDSIPISTWKTTFAKPVVTWDTHRFPNGDYQIRAIGGILQSEVMTPLVSVRIRN